MNHRLHNVVWIVTTTFVVLLFGMLGRDVGNLYLRIIEQFDIQIGRGLEIGSRLGIVMIMVLIGWLVGGALGRRAADVMTRLDDIPLAEKLAALGGTLLGLILAYLLLLLPLTLFRDRLPQGTILLIIIPVVGFTLYLCLRVMMAVKDELARIFPVIFSMRSDHRDTAVDETDAVESELMRPPRPKLLDTSVIIDGRLAGICGAGFIEGRICIPDFVLNELQQIGDSEDSIRRARGRRGLQILEELRRCFPGRVEIVEQYSQNVERAPTVDMKLVRLAEEMDATIVTNDQNLHRIAQLHRVPVMNVNVLADALKLVVLPGEHLDVRLVREGTQPGQGVGYLDDGTMVVVEGGRRFIGKYVRTIVRNVSQTAAGKMVFADFVTTLSDEDEELEGDLFYEDDSDRARRGFRKTDASKAQ